MDIAREINHPAHWFPREINHPAHRHSGPLTLFFHEGTADSACSICRKRLEEREPVYRCSGRDCRFKVDLSCSSIRSVIELQDGAHDHPLLCFAERVYDPKISCRWCQKECDPDLPMMFRCGECSFSLHLLCGPLPFSVQYSIYELTLTNSLIDNTGPDDVHCDICEEKRNPGECVYYNSDIIFRASIKCCLLPQIIPVLKGDLGDAELMTAAGHIRGKVIGGIQVEQPTGAGTELYSENEVAGEAESSNKTYVDDQSKEEEEEEKYSWEMEQSAYKAINDPAAKFLAQPKATGFDETARRITQELKGVEEYFKDFESETRYEELYEVIKSRYLEASSSVAYLDLEPSNYASYDVTESFLYNSSGRPADQIWDFPYSDDAFKQLKEQLEITNWIDNSHLTGWEEDPDKSVQIGNIMVHSRFVPLYRELVDKYGDFTAGGDLSPRSKALYLHAFFMAVYSMRVTRVCDITDDLLCKWQYYLRGMLNAGFQIPFALDNFEKLLRAYFGVKVSKFKDETTKKLEKQAGELQRQRDESEARLMQLKSITAKYSKPKEAEESLVNQCLIDAAEWKWKDVGDLIF